MKAPALILSLLAACGAVALAQSQPTGVSGYVLNADTKKPLAGADVAIYRMPMNNASLAVRTVHTNDKGFFAKISLEPGRYVITASANGLRAACATSDLVGGVVSHLRLEMARDREVCVGKNVQSALVVPGQTTDVYVVH